MSAFEEVAADYAGQCRAGRAIAEDYLRGEILLGELLGGIEARPACAS